MQVQVHRDADIGTISGHLSMMVVLYMFRAIVKGSHILVDLIVAPLNLICIYIFIYLPRCRAGGAEEVLSAEVEQRR